jgi:hypothetical protein
MANQVPFQRQRVQFGALGGGFLHVVLAERALAGGGQFRDGRRRLGLGHGKQARHWPLHGPRGVIKSLQDVMQGVREHVDKS